MSAISTMLAHEKDINSVDISQNDKLILTASMDKTVKLWHVHKDMHISLAETFGGHKRGVWCARFSRSSNVGQLFNLI
jgi:U3 small nucleolar RNA-associated protein 13